MSRTWFERKLNGGAWVMHLLAKLLFALSVTIKGGVVWGGLADLMLIGAWW